MPNTMEETIPYLLGALVIIVLAIAYFIRDYLKEKNRVERERNNLELAKSQLELRITAQEVSYRKELQDTIKELNDEMTTLRRGYQARVDELERRINELERDYKSRIAKLEREKTHLLRANNIYRDILRNANLPIPQIDTNATQEMPAFSETKSEESVNPNDGTEE